MHINAIKIQQVQKINIQIQLEDFAMAEAATRLPVRTEEKKGEEKSTAPQAWRPIEALRREIDHLFDDFDTGFWRLPFRRSVFDVEPFWRRELSWTGAPVVDIAESDKAYEITAELPGMDEKNIEVKLANGGLMIKGEKKEEKEEKKKDYYLHERHFGSFDRRFRVPEGVDADKIEAKFNKGVLTVTLPKKAEAQKPEKKIEVKAA
jgi:HSP20 family protein